MHTLRLQTPDGRALTLYGRAPIDPTLAATSPSDEPVGANSHLRWHPLRGEWTAYAAHRQNRTFLPSAAQNPLAPTSDPAHPTELPAGDYDVAVFENRFPTLSPAATDAPPLYVPTRPGVGACEVVVFTQDPGGALGRLPLDHIALLFEVWGERVREVGGRPGIEYVLPFENRGAEVGVTLHHPHGQIYAYPFVPPVPARAHEQERQFFEREGRTLMSDVVQNEESDGRRMLYAGPHAVAFVPAFARYTYEVWIAPRRAVPTVADLTDAERADMARALKTVLLTYDGLWNKPFPYLMAIHGSATDGRPHPEGHLHIEFSPPYRTETKLKFLAGTELAAGMFANDSLPEEKAKELQAVRVSLD
jgi:UDPglucose--hexose-1-phosphate uridylyltransferase